MCNKCGICNNDITLDDIKAGRRVIETPAKGGVLMSHDDCVARVVANLAAMQGIKPN